MITKNCKAILDFVISQPEEEHYRAYQIKEIEAGTGLSYEEIISAGKELDRLEYAELKGTEILGISVFDCITFSEKGIHYNEEIRENRINYIKDKWIDFSALLVAIAALIISIVALSKTVVD